jgi:EAL domain-containing protein (putative c-di-GMP-specific phosphodiesterase class I)
LLDDIDDCRVKLHALHQLGVQIAIDDFGIGHASVRDLSQLPLHSLKIDRSLIEGMADSAADRNLVSGIVGMARGLSLNAIAEGVETEAQKAFLKDLQCHEMQGHLFSRPETSHGIERILRLLEQGKLSRPDPAVEMAVR